MRARGSVDGFMRKVILVQDCYSRIHPHQRLSPTDCGAFAHLQSCDQNVVSLKLADSTLLETGNHSVSAAYALWSMHQFVRESGRELKGVPMHKGPKRPMTHSCCNHLQRLSSCHCGFSWPKGHRARLIELQGHSLGSSEIGISTPACRLYHNKISD